MQYFEAVKIGKRRASESQMRLFDVAGFAMLTLTTKKIDGEFSPVGESEYTAIIHTDDGFVVIIVDEDGYTKAQSKPLEEIECREFYKKLRDAGMEKFAKDCVSIWTQQYDIISDLE